MLSEKNASGRIFVAPASRHTTLIGHTATTTYAAAAEQPLDRAATSASRDPSGARSSGCRRRRSAARTGRRAGRRSARGSARRSGTPRAGAAARRGAAGRRASSSPARAPGARRSRVGRIALATMPATARIVTGIRKSVRSVRSDNRSPRAATGTVVAQVGSTSVSSMTLPGGIADERGAHGLAEVVARARRQRGTRRRAPRCRPWCRPTRRRGRAGRGAGSRRAAPISSTRAEVHLRGAELQPRALGAGTEVGAGERGEAERCRSRRRGRRRGRRP